MKANRTFDVALLTTVFREFFVYHADKLSTISIFKPLTLWGRSKQEAL